MKKLFGAILCLCMLFGMLTVSVSAQNGKAIEKIAITVPGFSVGGTPVVSASSVEVSDSDVTVVSVKWYDQHKNGVSKFEANQFYFCDVRIKVKSGAGKYIDDKTTAVTINGWEAKYSNIHKQYEEVTVTFKIPQRPGTEAPKEEAKPGSDYRDVFKPEPYQVNVGVNNIQPVVTFPVAGQKPEAPEYSDYISEMIGYKWEGKFDADGCFIAGEDYKLIMDFRIKANQSEQTRFIYQNGVLVQQSKITDKTDSEKTAYFVLTKKENKDITLETTFYGDGTALKLDAFARPVPKGQESPTTAYTAIKEIQFTIPEPVAYEHASRDVKLTAPADIIDKLEVVDVIWESRGNMMNSGGTFVDGMSYTAGVVLHIKSDDYKLYFNAQNVIVKCGESCQMTQVSEDRQYCVIACSFDPARSKEYKEQQAEKEQQKQEEAENSRPGTPVDKLQPGDSGSLRIQKNITFLHEPKEYKDPNAENSSYIPLVQEYIEVVEAYIPSLNRENQFYHAVKNFDGEIRYIIADRADFTAYRKTGNNPERPYATKFADMIHIGDPVEKLPTHSFKIVNGKQVYGKPVFDINANPGGNGEMFYLADIKYEYSDSELKPLMFANAIATYKTFDGYYFPEDMKLDEYHRDAGNTLGYKYIDEHTVEVYLTAFTGDMGINSPVTDEMKQYVKDSERATNFPIAEVGFVSPIYEYWNTKLKNKDYEYNAKYINDFLTANEINIYEHPASSANVLRTIKGGTYMDISDDDLSDDFPGLVGDWVALRSGGFIPKSFVGSISYNTAYTGAPAHYVRSPFKFAGGSGTKEDPYLIETAEQLNAIRFGLDYHYKLISDIDLSTWGNWMPIGGSPAYGGMPNNKYNQAQDYTSYFGGSLDGDGHVISGMTIVINEENPFMMEDGNIRYYGLFSLISNAVDNYSGPAKAINPDKDFSKAGIFNLGIVNYNIDVTYTGMEGKLDLRIWAGALAGETIDCCIHDVYTSGGKINFNTPVKASQVAYHLGGIIGTATGTDIRRCYNTSDITLNAPVFDLRCGGIATVLIESYVTECYNTGNITLPVEGNDGWISCYATGIAAGVEPAGESGKKCLIRNCYNTGNITASCVAGVLYYTSGRTSSGVSGCYNIGKLTFNKEWHEYHRIDGNNVVVSVPMSSATVSNNFGDGTSVQGSAYRNSSSLGRKVLVSIPEDAQPNRPYSFKSGIVGNFADVSLDAWYASPVRWAVQAKVTNGTSDTTFSPDNTCTRAQILTFLWRAAGSPYDFASSVNPFTDVNPSDYYYKAAIWANEMGMVSGTVFAGDTPCTRRETVVYLWQYDGSPKGNQYQGNFTDVSADDPCATAVAWALRYGITSGTSDTTFSPEMTCTRGQIVTFLYRSFQGI